MKARTVIYRGLCKYGGCQIYFIIINSIGIQNRYKRAFSNMKERIFTLSTVTNFKQLSPGNTQAPSSNTTPKHRSSPHATPEDLISRFFYMCRTATSRHRTSLERINCIIWTSAYFAAFESVCETGWKHHHESINRAMRRKTVVQVINKKGRSRFKCRFL